MTATLSRPTGFSLDQPVQFLKGVGPRRAAQLARLPVRTVRDLLTWFPRAHDDRRHHLPLSRLRPGPGQTAQGRVVDFSVRTVSPALVLGEALLKDETGQVTAVWFRRRSLKWDPFATLKKQLVPGVEIRVFGAVGWGRQGLQVRVEEHEWVEGETSGLHTGRLTPIYALTEGLDMRHMRTWIREAVDLAAPQWMDPLPRDFLDQHHLEPLSWALPQFHFPDSPDHLRRARRRVVFEELFFFELAVAQVRRRSQAGPGARPCVPTRALLSPFRQGLGFEFTPAQKKVINEIFVDMARPVPMRRLLQGDVGSGKTVVALSALLLAVENGAQGALMAPTEILAEQHAATLAARLKGLPVRWELFRGGASTQAKRQKLEALAKGDIQLAVGTHALLQSGVTFRQLGAVVVDEQHRFGVRQRADLGAKGLSPHVLIMTATPIPRTLALTFYGDLAVSTLDSSPPGRTPVRTLRATESAAWEMVRREIHQGRQAFVVVPLVEESELLDLKAAVQEFERLKTVFPGARLGLLHGRLPSAEKTRVMRQLSEGDLDLLVATPVIEVGIDVPNATAMVVLHAERFGLAQLHQLRGRVGRGPHPSQCILVSPVGLQGAGERLDLLCRIRDGFRLAEEDLRLRGPGEFLGEAQHGVLTFKAADLVTDGPLLEEARREAWALLDRDPDLSQPQHAALKSTLQHLYAHRLPLAQVG